MNLKQALRNTLSDKELHLLVRSYDVVGDIAIIIIPAELEQYAEIIGKTICALNKRIKVVARRAGNCSGEFRTMPLDIIAGEKRFETTHREFGVAITLDVQQSYFSTRSGTERKRIATLITKPERVLVMFSGVAPYPLVIGRHSSAAAIIGVEKNTAAHRYAQLNVQKNKLSSRIELFQGDVRSVIPQLDMVFDRIIMPLPASAHCFLDLAIAHLKPGGRLHCYDFQPPDQFDTTLHTIAQAAAATQRTIRADNIVACGHNSPKSYRICADVTIF